MPQWQLESHLLSIRTPPRDSLLAISEKPQQLPLAQSEVIETQRVLLSIPQRHFQPLRLMGAAAQRAVLRWDKPSRASSVELLKEREKNKTLLLGKRPIHPLITRLSCCSWDVSRSPAVWKTTNCWVASAHRPAARPSVITRSEYHCCSRLSGHRLKVRSISVSWQTVSRMFSSSQTLGLTWGAETQLVCVSQRTYLEPEYILFFCPVSSCRFSWGCPKWQTQVSHVGRKNSSPMQTLSKST